MSSPHTAHSPTNVIERHPQNGAIERKFFFHPPPFPIVCFFSRWGERSTVLSLRISFVGPLGFVWICWFGGRVRKGKAQKYGRIRLLVNLFSVGEMGGGKGSSGLGKERREGKGREEKGREIWVQANEWLMPEQRSLSVRRNEHPVLCSVA